MTPDQAKQRRGTILLLWSVLALSFAFVHQRNFDNGTPVSRLDFLRAVFAEGRVSIDTFHTNTEDKAVWQNHYYSDKAPGTAALALPSYALAATALKVLGLPMESHKAWLTTSWVACAGSVAIVTAFGGIALFSWLSLRVAASSALVTTLALFLGAAPLPYSTILFSHALVAGMIAIALWAIEKQARLQPAAARTSWPQRAEKPDAQGGAPSSERGVQTWLTANRWDLLAGHCCGWALASEYTAGIVLAGLFVWLLASGRRRAIPFCAAALPPLLLIPAYSYACFHHPFILPYSLEASFPAMKEGLYAIKWPNPETAFNLLFTPTRGLFFWTPFLLMAGVGYWKLIRSHPRLFWLTYSIPLLQVIVISGRTWDWQAGFTLGPRYLAPMLPLMALPCALGVQRFPKIGVSLAAYSILITTLATLTNACPNYSIYNPLTELNMPLFIDCEFSPNLGMVLGLPPYVSVAVYYAILIGGISWLWRTLAATEASRSKSAHPTPAA